MSQNHRNRVAALEAHAGDEWACCILSSQDFSKYAARGVCKRSGGPVCEFQAKLAVKGAERSRQLEAILTRAAAD